MRNQRKYNKENLQILFKDLARRLGRQPSLSDWIKDKNTPSYMPIKWNFGKNHWSKFLKTMGLNILPTPRPSRTRKGIKNKKGVKRILNIHGYIEIHKPEHPMAKADGRVKEHRMIAYDAGILRDRKLEVHHINGIKTDNRIENLQIMTKADHARVTIKNIIFTPEQRKRGVVNSWKTRKLNAKLLPKKK